MIRWRPELTDRILMGLGRQRGPAVDTSAQDAITRSVADEFERNKAAEDVQRGLNLSAQQIAASNASGRRRLDLNQEQFEARRDLGNEQFGKNLNFDKYRFNTGMANARDEAQYNRRAGDTAALISIGGLGLSGVQAYQTGKQAYELEMRRKQLIDKYSKAGDSQTKFYADLLSLL